MIVSGLVINSIKSMESTVEISISPGVDVTGPGVRRGAARTWKSSSSFLSQLNSLRSGSVEGAPPLRVQLWVGHISAEGMAAEMLYSKFFEELLFKQKDRLFK